ncbi:MAG: hypothetical protein KDK06_09230 [Gammaproteobacteria bacterium]|nr:hypothetical protein [Gammaproteobacteria bacterium]
MVPPGLSLLTPTLLPLALAAIVAIRRPAAGLRSAASTCLGAALAALALAATGAAASDLRALLVAFVAAALVAAAVLAFSARYMAGEPRAGRYARDAVLLVGCLLLAIVSDHIALFAAAWAGASWLVTRLLEDHAAPTHAARAAERARTSFLPADGLMLAALAGLVAASGASGFAALGAWLEASQGGDLLVHAAALAVVGAAAVRAAALPAHRWLLSTVSAPTPLCALLHAGFVNAGAIAVIKLAALFALSPIALAALLVAGAVAMVGGKVLGHVRSDVKGRLAASTIAQMGYMLMQCGLGAFAHAVIHLAAHAAFKADAFVRAGSQVAVPLVTRAVPAGVAGWLLFLPVVLFLGLQLATSLAVPDALLVTFATSLLLESALSAWRHAAGLALLRQLVPVTGAAIAATTLLHEWLGPLAAPSGLAASAATAHLAAAVVAALSVIAFVRHGGLALSPSLFTRLLRLAHGARRRTTPALDPVTSTGA